MDELERLRNIDNDIYKVFEDAVMFFPRLLNLSDFPYTTEICFMYIHGTEYLKNSIFDCVEKDDFYSINILFRSIIEHFLRFQYFWFNFGSTNEDSYSFKFRTAIDFNERITMEKSLNAVRQLENIKPLTSDEIWDGITKQSKDFKNLTKNEIKDFSQKISIKNIIRFVEKSMKDGGFPTDYFLKKLLVKYSEMSSFVHGGLHAHKKMIKIHMDSDRRKKLIAICGLALQTASFIKLFSYLSLHQAQPEYGVFYYETEKHIKRIHNYS